MIQWEYKVFFESGKWINKERLDELGKEGWELVSIVVTGINRDDKTGYYFKRPSAQCNSMESTQ